MLFAGHLKFLYIHQRPAHFSKSPYLAHSIAGSITSCLGLVAHFIMANNMRQDFNTVTTQEPLPMDFAVLPKFLSSVPHSRKSVTVAATEIRSASVYAIIITNFFRVSFNDEC
jgi:hypothetical protein